MNVFYTNFGVLDGSAGTTRGPLIFIRPQYKSDVGLLKHEQTHVKQWFRTLGMHSLLYMFSDSYKLAAEVECYREQAKHYADDRTPMFAVFISQDYGLSITAKQALKLLRD
jgi:hypothetical protein